ncbi:MAG: hypothetical protein ACOYMB_05205 [Patescibacteria group bacterium]
MNISKETKRLDSENILILIDAWKSYRFLFSFVKKSIPEKYGYIYYSYPDELLNPNPSKTKENFLQLIKTIIDDLELLQKTKPRSFYMYGRSLGGLFCMIVSDKIVIKKMMLIVPGSNLAEAFWLGGGTRQLKIEMERQYKTTLLELKERWKEISPDYYFKEKSLNTRFFIILSKNDKVIPRKNGDGLIEILKKQNIKFLLKESIFSHRLVCIKESILLKNFKKWISEI